MTTTWTPTELRKADLATMRDALADQSTRRRDLVVAADQVRMDDDGFILVPEEQVDISLEGVTSFTAAEPFVPTEIADGHLAERLGIPVRYFRRMRDGHLPLLAENVNHWLQADDRTIMLRTYTRDGAPGILRAVLSDRYSIIDNFDVMLSVLAGVRASGLDPSAIQINGDLTERRMRLRITAPQIGINVGDILGDYKSPFTGQSAQDLPMMWAGLEVGNSETGGGAFHVVPRVELEVCKNGMVRKEDLTRAVHLGGKLEQGTVRWSEDTQRKALELVTARTRDAVTDMLSTDYLQRVADQMRESQGIRVAKPAETIEVVAKGLGMTEAEQDQLLGAFIAGGQSSALGVGHAVTAMAQDTEDPERAAELEAAFFPAIALAS